MQCRVKEVETRCAAVQVFNYLDKNRLRKSPGSWHLACFQEPRHKQSIRRTRRLYLPNTHGGGFGFRLIGCFGGSTDRAPRSFYWPGQFGGPERRWRSCGQSVKSYQEVLRAAERGSVPDTPPRVQGKFFFLGDEKLYVRGVTYGTFRSNEQGEEFPPLKVVNRDFARMAATGVNAVRTYTPPPLWLLDAAHRQGLRIMAGLPVERSVAFLDYRKCARSIEEMVRAEVRARAGHPAILCYTIGNEIPASIVRWHGRRKLERFLERLYWAAKDEDPQCLVTYVNYPSTEYLHLSFLDFACFNVYLES